VWLAAATARQPYRWHGATAASRLFWHDSARMRVQDAAQFPYFRVQHTPSMMRLCPFLTFSLALCAMAHGAIPGTTADTHALAAATEVTGVVYHDRNGNGVHDPGEPGVAGVLVSNQRDVVPSDTAGRYALPVRDNMTIFVTKPAGYQFHLDRNNLPQFYHHHAPAGSPADLRYPGIAPSGPLPDSLDFALVAVDEPDRFTFMAFGDPQTQTHAELDYLRDKVIAALPDGQARFTITLGDLLFDRLDLYPRYQDIFGRIGTPWYNAPGNHDLNFVPDRQHAFATFRRHFGPDYYAFTYGRAHFIVLNTVDWFGEGPHQGNNYRGGIDSVQMAWIANHLRHVPADDLLVFAMHIPLFSEIDSDPRRIIAERAAFLDLVRDRRHLLALAGHVHTNEFLFLGPDQGWHGEADFLHMICGAVSGTWWSGPRGADGAPVMLQLDGAPSGVFLFHVDGNQFQEAFHPLGLPSDEQIRVPSPRGVVARGRVDATPLLVQVFIGNDRTRVAATIDGIRIPLRRQPQMDPVKAGLIERHQESYRRWVRPRPSTHIWEARLPGNLPAGVHRIDIEATLHDGRRLTGKHLFEIAEDDD
jgi:hypothetical protein